MIKRRQFLKQAGLGLGAGGMALAGASAAPLESRTVSGNRPRFIWDNREDEIYHEVRPIGDEFTAHDPWYYAFYDKSWVYNRSMTWRRTAGTILAYEATGDLMLTGAGQQSAWFTGPENSLQDQGQASRFRKNAANRRIDCAVLPTLTFHLGQHPVFEIAVTDASADWQFCIGLKGRAGPPLVCSGWQTGAKTLRFDVARLLRQFGYEKNYAEMHFIVGTWVENPNAPANLDFTLRGIAQPAVVACLPLIRTSASAAGGTAVTALLVDAVGQLSRAARPTATIDGKSVAMTQKDGVWQAIFVGLSPGDYRVDIAAPGFASSAQFVRITDGIFCSYDPATGYAKLPGRQPVPLTGSYEGSFFVRDAGLKSEQLVMGQAEWDSWDREGGTAERMHGWESLTPEEMDGYFAFLAKNGWDLLHLHQYWGIWERLDAFGNIAPHGAEQLALYLRTAARHNLHSVQALSSYSYSKRLGNHDWWGTVPWKQTLEAGFRDEEWYMPQPGAFQTALHSYLTDFVTLFREETALFALSASGEGDHTNKLPRSNDIFQFVRNIDKNHIFYGEAILNPKRLYDIEVQGWNQDYRGARSYSYGQGFNSELDLGIFFKFLKMTSRLVMAEGAWPASNLYTQFLSGRGRQSAKVQAPQVIQPESWVGTELYRTHIRDTIYIGMTNQAQIMMTWDEKITEDEHLIFSQARQKIIWDQPFQSAQIALLGHDDNSDHGKRGIYGQYEKAFRELGLNYKIVSERMQPFGNDLVIYDTEAPYEKPAFQTDGGRIPDSLRATVPIRAGPGYFTSWCWSEDRKTLLAYFYNVTRHEEKKFVIAPTFHRVPNAAPFVCEITFRPQGGDYVVYDLNDKKTLRQGRASDFTGFALPATRHDFLLILTP